MKNYTKRFVQWHKDSNFNLIYSFYYICPEFEKRIFGMFWMGYIDCKVNQALPRPLIIDPLLKGCIVCHKSIPKGSKLDQKSNRHDM